MQTIAYINYSPLQTYINAINRYVYLFIFKLLIVLPH